MVEHAPVLILDSALKNQVGVTCKALVTNFGGLVLGSIDHMGRATSTIAVLFESMQSERMDFPISVPGTVVGG